MEEELVVGVRMRSRGRSGMCDMVEEFLRTVLADISGRTQGLLVAVTCVSHEVVETAEVYPFTRVGGLGEADAPPIAEGDAETATRGSPDEFVEA